MPRLIPLSTDTQGSQGERKGEGETRANVRFGNQKKWPSANNLTEQK